MKKPTNALAEIKKKVAAGYKAELIYNFGTSQYIITTWKNANEDIKQYKIHKDEYSSNVLKKAVYGKI